MTAIRPLTGTATIFTSRAAADSYSAGTLRRAPNYRFRFLARACGIFRGFAQVRFVEGLGGVGNKAGCFFQALRPRRKDEDLLPLEPNAYELISIRNDPVKLSEIRSRWSDVDGGYD